MRKILYFLFLACLPLSGGELRLKGKLAEAQPGSYLVLEQNKTFTFFHVHDRFDNKVIIEEVSIPAASCPSKQMDWKQWFERGAAGHTGWMISRIDLQTALFEETFSFTHKGWVDMRDTNPFLTTLLNLSFKTVSEADRRRVGLPPGYNKTDHRPIWNPRLVVEGQIQEDVSFSAFRARWPSDGSELSHKYIEIYLPNVDAKSEASSYPLYFPYWLEIEGKIGSAKIRVVDSGMNARSPKKFFFKNAALQYGS
jgi:hypothetical protein